jgi:hypothetical protein
MKALQKLLIVMVMTLFLYAPLNAQGIGAAITDTAFIRKNITDNLMEIRMLEIGREKGDKDLKKLAGQMLGDHFQILEDLKRTGRKKDMDNINVTTDGTTVGNNVAPSGTPDTITAPVNGIATKAPVTASTAGNATATTAGTGTMDNSGSRVATSVAPASGATTASPATSISATNNNGVPMHSMHDFDNLTGTAFATKWTAQMLAMHKAKLSELQAASQRIKDAELLEVINKAIPKIRSHVDMLSGGRAGSR